MKCSIIFLVVFATACAYGLETPNGVDDVHDSLEVLPLEDYSNIENNEYVGNNIRVRRSNRCNWDSDCRQYCKSQNDRSRRWTCTYGTCDCY